MVRVMLLHRRLEITLTRQECVANYDVGKPHTERNGFYKHGRCVETVIQERAYCLLVKHRKNIVAAGDVNVVDSSFCPGRSDWHRDTRGIRMQAWCMGSSAFWKPLCDETAWFPPLSKLRFRIQKLQPSRWLKSWLPVIILV